MSIPGRAWALDALDDNADDSGRVPAVVVVSFVLFGRITDVTDAVLVALKMWASDSFRKCLDAPLSAFRTTGIDWFVWATGRVLISVKVLFNLLFTELLRLTGLACQVMFLVLPPMQFANVASFLWPSAGVRLCVLKLSQVCS